ncbi:GtrA family protein [Variovorax sp. PBL-E5]|uniref:GtrA family protein n=1 Tax=Variovorax sp. PBL-E5 TaxID=434014 RepID=UPI0013A59457|nr:GtrA family protein [Variovorax sp. PBL-E5]
MNARHSFIKFLIVGSLATAIHYSVFYGLYRIAGLPAVPSTSAGFAASAVFNFAANYRFTFRSRARWDMAALRYVLIAGIGLLINALIFSALHEWGGLGSSYSQLLATGVVLVWNYLGGKYFIFRYKELKA